MPDLATATQDAIYAALNVTAVTDLAPVYQHVPENTDPPIVIVGDINFEPIGAKDGGLDRASAEIVSFYRGPKRAGLYDIQAVIRDALDGQSIAATGALFSHPVQVSSEAELLEDGITYQGIQTFELIVQPA